MKLNKENFQRRRGKNESNERSSGLIENIWSFLREQMKQETFCEEGGEEPNWIL